MTTLLLQLLAAVKRPARYYICGSRLLGAEANYGFSVTVMDLGWSPRIRSIFTG
jgi:hypothetical protein